jgi:hypothetical protein
MPQQGNQIKNNEKSGERKSQLEMTKRIKKFCLTNLQERENLEEV